MYLLLSSQERYPDLSLQNWEVKVVEDKPPREKVIVDEEKGEHTMVAEMPRTLKQDRKKAGVLWSKFALYLRVLCMVLGYGEKHCGNCEFSSLSPAVGKCSMLVPITCKCRNRACHIFVRYIYIELGFGVENYIFCFLT